MVDQAFIAHHAQHGESEGGIAAGIKLQMEIGRRRGLVAHRIDDDHLGRGLLQPMLMRMRCRGGWIGAPDEDTGGVFRCARIEAQ